MSVMIRRSTVRRGVSLLEILICIGILSVGLLGVVALIPVGQFSLLETNKADRSTACAKAAKAQVEIRGMLDPTGWIYRSGGVWAPYPPSCLVTDPRSTIVLDPLGHIYAHSLGMTNAAANFPFPPTGVTPGTDPPAFPYLRRCSTVHLFDISGTLPVDVQIALNEMVCRWSDDSDIIIDDSDPDLRPRQAFAFDTEDYGPYPPRSNDDPQIPPTAQTLQRGYKGDFSWFLTITPDMTEAFFPVSEMKNFEVSVVVCYKRDFLGMDPTAPVPMERAVYVDLASFSGIGGSGASDLPLALPTGTSDIAERLEVKPGQWIMLVGEQQIVNTSTVPPTVSQRTIARWYRVLSVDDELDDKDDNNILFDHSGVIGQKQGQIRWVMVNGPEWRSGTMPGEILNTQAVIVDGVIGVFTETMTLDR